MYDLRAVVGEVRGICDLPMTPGDYFEVKGGRTIVPAGKHICLWALQSLMPILPVKQREIAEENDWIPRTTRIWCSNPNGQVIYRTDRVDPRTGEPVDAGRALTVDLTSGSFTFSPLEEDLVELEPVPDEYYEARGWDVATGVPTREKLEELGLGDVVRDLEGWGVNVSWWG